MNIRIKSNQPLPRFWSHISLAHRNPPHNDREPSIITLHLFQPKKINKKIDIVLNVL